MVVATLTAVAAAGATTVYFVGEAQHRRDRADITAWEARALSAAREASSVRDSLRAMMPLSAIVAARSTLTRDLNTITAAPLPGIVRPTVAAYVDAIRRTNAALDAVGSSSFAEAWRRAGAAFAAASTTEQNLVCKARLPACGGP